MKKILLSFLFIYSCLLVKGQSKAAFEILPSIPGQELELSISHLSTDMIISGYPGESVLLEVFRKGKKLKINEYPVSFTEDQNKIILSNLSRSDDLEFRMKVPHTTSLDLRTEWASFIEIYDIKGDVKVRTSTTEVKIDKLEGNLDLRTFSGDISVSNMIGSPLIHSTKGDITFSYTHLDDTYPNILDSVNGLIQLFIKPQAKLSLRIRFDTGIHGKMKLISEVDLLPMNPTDFPIGMGQADKLSMYRVVNGGGAPLYLKTFKGSVKILER